MEGCAGAAKGTLRGRPRLRVDAGATVTSLEDDAVERGATIVLLPWDLLLLRD